MNVLLRKESAFQRRNQPLAVYLSAGAVHIIRAHKTQPRRTVRHGDCRHPVPLLQGTGRLARGSRHIDSGLHQLIFFQIILPLGDLPHKQGRHLILRQSLRNLRRNPVQRVGRVLCAPLLLRGKQHWDNPLPLCLSPPLLRQSFNDIIRAGQLRKLLPERADRGKPRDHRVRFHPEHTGHPGRCRGISHQDSILPFFHNPRRGALLIRRHGLRRKRDRHILTLPGSEKLCLRKSGQAPELFFHT